MSLTSIGSPSVQEDVWDDALFILLFFGDIDTCRRKKGKTIYAGDKIHDVVRWR